MASSVPSRSFGKPSGSQPGAGLAVALLRAIAESVEPRESELLVEPLAQVVALLGSCPPGSLFSEWAPPPRQRLEPVPLTKARAFADESKDAAAFPPEAALSSTTDTPWVSGKVKDGNKWTLQLPEPMVGLAELVLTFGTEGSADVPSSVTAEVSADGVTFIPAGPAVVLSKEDSSDKPSEDAEESDPMSAGSAEEAKDADEVARLPLAPARPTQFIRVITRGKSGDEASVGTPCTHCILGVELLRQSSSRFSDSSGSALDAILQACAVAGHDDAAASSREAAIAASLAAAGATASARALTLAYRILLRHAANGATTLPTSLIVPLRRIASIVASEARNARSLAAGSLKPLSQGPVLVDEPPAAGSGGSVEPKFDTHHKGSGCEIDQGGRMWRSTSSSENYATATTGIKSGVATWEFMITEDSRDNEQTCMGIARRPVRNGSYQSSEDMWMIRAYNGLVYHEGSGISISNIHPDDKVKFRADMKRGTVHVWINGAPQNSGEPVFTGLRGLTIYPAVCGYSSGKQIKFLSYSMDEASAGSGASMPAVVSSNKDLATEVSATPQVEAPALESGASKFFRVNDENRKDAAAFSPTSSAPAVLKIAAAGAVAALKGGMPMGSTVRCFTAHFGRLTPAHVPSSLASSCPAASAAVSALGRLQKKGSTPRTLVSVAVDGTQQWRALIENEASLLSCRVPASDASIVTVTVSALSGEEDVPGVFMVDAGFSFGDSKVDLAEAIPLLGDATALGLSTPLLQDGGELSDDGSVPATVPLHQFLGELVALHTELLNAEARVTEAGLASVGPGGRNRSAGAAPGGASDEEKEKAAEAAEKEERFATSLSTVEAPLTLDTSDAAVEQIAKLLQESVATSESHPALLALAHATATCASLQARVWLQRVCASGIRPADLGVSLPGSKTAEEGPLSRLHAGLGVFDSEAGVTSAGKRLPRAASLALTAVDAGTPIFYPTASLRRKLVQSLVSKGATMEVQVRYPTLRSNAIAKVLGASASQSSDAAVALAERTAEAHPSLRDGRFERLIMLLQLDCKSRGWNVQLTGQWGGSLHLVVQLPAGAGTEVVSFLSTHMQSIFKRCNMSTWKLPQGCSKPAIPLEICRGRATDRVINALATAAIRIFPASTGLYEDILSDVKLAVAAGVPTSAPKVTRAPSQGIEEESSSSSSSAAAAAAAAAAVSALGADEVIEVSAPPRPPSAGGNGPPPPPGSCNSQ
jgi:hypothetical protein